MPDGFQSRVACRCARKRDAWLLEAWTQIAWDDEDNPRGNVQHIAANGLTVEEVEQVLHDPANRPTISRSTGRPAVFGATATGKDILVVYEVLETEPVIVIRPITAYELMPE
jgi:uncharacterized DUF497 family protein